jgi:hypothetical protein
MDRQAFARHGQPARPRRADNTGKHAKIAATVLRRTSSHSPRLIWENEVRPRVAYTSEKVAAPRLSMAESGAGETDDDRRNRKAPARASSK